MYMILRADVITPRALAFFLSVYELWRHTYTKTMIPFRLYYFQLDINRKTVIMKLEA